MEQHACPNNEWFQFCHPGYHLIKNDIYDGISCTSAPLVIRVKATSNNKSDKRFKKIGNPPEMGNLQKILLKIGNSAENRNYSKRNGKFLIEIIPTQVSPVNYLNVAAHKEHLPAFVYAEQMAVVDVGAPIGGANRLYSTGTLSDRSAVRVVRVCR